MNNAIELDRLSKRFKATEALKDVSLDMPKASVSDVAYGENRAAQADLEKGLEFLDC